MVLYTRRRRRAKLTEDRGAVFNNTGLVEKILSFSDKKEYLYLGGVSNPFNEIAKRRAPFTSVSAALASKARLEWAFDSGLLFVGQLIKLICSLGDGNRDQLELLDYTRARAAAAPASQQAMRRVVTEASERGKLPLLRWALRCGLTFDPANAGEAARRGEIGVLALAAKRGLLSEEHVEEICVSAAQNAKLAVLEWLVEQEGDAFVLDEFVCVVAEAFGCNEIVLFVHDNEYPCHHDHCRDGCEACLAFDSQDDEDEHVDYYDLYGGDNMEDEYDDNEHYHDHDGGEFCPGCGGFH
ncbi:unnamed protein product [Phaeothamnion confervicola]